MKIFQILNNMVHWESHYKSIEETIGLYAPDIIFVEAPDYVREGWGYIDGEFIKPEAPKGWAYDEKTGTFYPIDEEIIAQINNRNQNNVQRIIDSTTSSRNSI